MTAIEFFAPHGFSYEHPGYLETAFLDSRISIGVRNEAFAEDTPSTAKFTVQIETSGGATVFSSEELSAENAIALIQNFRGVAGYFRLQGFQLYCTGGNCGAYQKALPELGLEILITVAEDAAAPATIDEPVVVGLYAVDSGEQLATIKSKTTAQAFVDIQAGKWLAPTE
jgi:hypothetical protein